MPEAFNKCRKQGGKITTKKLPNNKYIHICWLRGQSFSGEVKAKKSKK